MLGKKVGTSLVKGKTGFLFSAIIFLSSATRVSASKPDLIVQYHLWYNTPYGVESDVYPTSEMSDTSGQYIWGHWDCRDHGVVKQSPSIVRPDGVKRYGNVSSEAYPMIGFYDPDDERVLRWHIRLAKAAGIKAFSASLYDWPNNRQMEHKNAEVFRKMLDIAQEENFKIGWEIWWGGRDMPRFFAQYKDIFNHPAMHRIDGKPVIRIAVADDHPFFGESKSEIERNMAQIEAAIGGDFYWIVDGGNAHYLWETDQDICMMAGSNLFTSFDNWKNALPGSRDKAHKNGHLSCSHIYPGFDSKVVPQFAGVRYHSRRSGNELAQILRESNQANVDLIFLESWNDFGEATAIEPGTKEDFYSGNYQKDYYKDLKIIANFYDKKFIKPPLPPVSSMDPLVREKLSKRVSFKGKVALSDSASGSNGVKYALQLVPFNGNYVSLFEKIVNHSDGVVEINEDITDIYGKQRRLLLNVDTNGGHYQDQAFWLEAAIYIDGRKVYDLIDLAPTAHWHSSVGDIDWGTGGEDGTAKYATVRASNGQVYTRVLYVHPDYNENGFTHGSYRPMDLIASVVLPTATPTAVTARPSATRTPTATNAPTATGVSGCKPCPDGSKQPVGTTSFTCTTDGKQLSDYTLWQEQYLEVTYNGQTIPVAELYGDYNCNGRIDLGDYSLWQAKYLAERD